jgi:hypothetical protein
MGDMGADSDADSFGGTRHDGAKNTRPIRFLIDFANSANPTVSCIKKQPFRKRAASLLELYVI